MTLQPFFTYFGGKYRAAPHYPTPGHDLIIEPFAGSAGYALRHHEKKVILVDLNEQVIGTWDYLIHASPDEIMRLPIYDGTWETVDDLSIPQEARWLIGWWVNKGASTPRKSPSAWMRSGIRPNSYWGEVIRARISGQVDHIGHWEARLGSYEDMGNRPATWFIDPPYEVAGRDYKHSSIDYAHLGDWCRSRLGQVIVCENEGAEWLPFSLLRSSKATPGKGRTGSSQEVIWTTENNEAALAASKEN